MKEVYTPLLLTSSCELLELSASSSSSSAWGSSWSHGCDTVSGCLTIESGYLVLSNCLGVVGWLVVVVWSSSCDFPDNVKGGYRFVFVKELGEVRSPVTIEILKIRRGREEGQGREGSQVRFGEFPGPGRFTPPKGG